MNTHLLACLVLSACVVWEAAGSLHDDIVRDLDHEVIYRVTRGTHGKKKGQFYGVIHCMIDNLLEVTPEHTLY